MTEVWLLIRMMLGGLVGIVVASGMGGGEAAVYLAATLSAIAAGFLLL